MIKVKQFTSSANIEFISIVDSLLKDIDKVGYKKAFTNNVKKNNAFSEPFPESSWGAKSAGLYSKDRF